MESPSAIAWALCLQPIDKSRGEGAKAKDLAGQAVAQLVETVGEEHPDSRRARELATAATLSQGLPSDR